MSDQKIMGDMLREHPYNPDTAIHTIFEYQRKFAGKFIPFDKIRERAEYGNYDLMVQWVEELCICLMDEVSEVLNWTNWKHWRSYRDAEPIKRSEIAFEMIDILHFLVNLYQVAGLAPEPMMIEPNEAVLQLPPLSDEELTLKLKEWVKRMILGIGDVIKFPDVTFMIPALSSTLRQGFEILRLSKQDIFNYYMSKNEENFRRQANGY